MATAAEPQLELSDANVEILLDLLENDQDFEQNLDELITEVSVNLVIILVS